jgi:hypothetical protein
MRRLYSSPWAKILGGFAILLSSIATAVTFGAASAALAITTITVITALAATTVAAGIAGMILSTITGLIDAYKNDDLDLLAADSKFQNLGSNKSSYLAYGSEHIGGLYVEREINTGLRNSGNAECTRYYDYVLKIKRYFRNSLMYWDEDNEKWQSKGLACPEYYNQNPDFTRRNKEKVFFPLPLSYNCCTECLEEYPARTYYSEQRFQEEIADNYRVILPNNFRDIETENGIITGFSRQGNSLFIHSAESLWQLPQNFQQQVTTELVTWLGTGEFFSIPPRRIMHGQIGSGGCVDKWSILPTDGGVIFMDRENTTFYLMNEGLKPLSINGMQRFFDNNANMYLSDQFLELTGETFPNDPNPANPSGIGYLATYDKTYSRYILTKKDYEILDTVTFQIGSVGATGMYFDTELRMFFVGSTIIYLDNTTYFRNRSWTLSFSSEGKNNPLSFHSYLPNYYFHNQDAFLSYISGNDNIWAHDDIQNFTKYYGVKHDWIIEMLSVSSPITTRTTEAIMYQAIARKYFPQDEQWVEQRYITFDEVILYNSRQCSGAQVILVKDTRPNIEEYLEQQIENNQAVVIANEDEEDWTINNLRDYVIDPDIPFFTRDWTLLGSSYFADKILNPPALDFSKEWSEREPFRDKFLIIRFKFDKFDNVNMILKFMMEQERQSIR